MQPVAPIQVYTLSRFRVLKKGQPLTENGEGQRRPLDLLKVLIALGGEAIPQEQVCEALWPDSDGDAARSTLSATLHRLRRIVGQEAVRLRQGKITVEPRQCWVDCAEFTRSLEAVAHALERGDLDEAGRAMDAALALYRGPFLDGEFEPAPILNARERLHSLFLRHVARLGEALAGAGQWRAAGRLYQAGLEADPVAEELAQHLMRALQRQGRLAEALSAYHRCRDALRSAAGVDPSSETEAILREIAAGESASPRSDPMAEPVTTPSAVRGPIAPPEGATMAAVGAQKRSRLPRSWLALGTLGLAGLAVTVWALLRAGALIVEGDSVGPPLPDNPSLAVMPFENLSGDPAQAFFSDGFTETLTTGLSRLRDLLVIDPNSAFALRDRMSDPQEIGRALRVGHLLVGAIQRDAEQLRITVRLLQAESGRQVWTERYDRPLSAVFEVQDEITARITSELEVKLVEGEQARVWQRATSSFEAYEHYLRGRALHVRISPQDNARAREHFLEASRLEPGFALPLAYIGWTYDLEADFGWAPDPEENWRRAREYAMRAIELGDHSGIAYNLLAMLALVRQSDADQAVRFSEMALELNPNSAKNLFLASIFLNMAGRYDEADSSVRAAFRLDPIPPHYYHLELGWPMLAAGKADEAARAIRKCVEPLPDHVPCRVGLIVALGEAGRYDQARIHVTELLRIDPRFSTDQFVKRFGDPVMRERAREQLRATGVP